MIRALGDAVPAIAESARIDDSATIIGDVTLEENASVWPGAVLRADHGGEIIIREGANVQDNVVFHADAPDQQVVIGKRATIGHNATVHDATVERRGLVGMNAVVLDDAVIEEYGVVGANSLVTEGQTVPSHSLAVGSPAEVVREDLDESSDFFTGGDTYVELARTYTDEGRVLDRDDVPEP